jgi:hypothetical protein
MDRLRWIVVLVITAALAGGVAGRFRYANSALAESQAEIRQPSDSDDMRLAGVFNDSLSSRTGYELVLPRCSRPLAVLPVATRALAVPPREYDYPHAGEYAVSYIFNGRAYPEEWIGGRLRFLRALYRFQSLFGLTDARSYAFFLKLWVPAECAGVSTAEAEALQRSLITIAPAKPL